MESHRDVAKHVVFETKHPC